MRAVLGSWADMAGEALAGVLGRPGRSALTALGTLLGVTALVATVGIAQTAGNQIVSRFDELAATEVTLAAVPPAGADATPRRLPWDGAERVARLNGAVAAATHSQVNIGGHKARAVPLVDPLAPDEAEVPVVAASPGLLGAVRGSLRTGRFIDPIHDLRGDAVAVLGPGAAARLRVSRVDNQPAVFVGDQALTVIGIIDGVARQPDLLNAIIVPNRTARALWGLDAPARILVDTQVGAAGLIARQGPMALSPNAPELVRASRAADAGAVQGQVKRDVSALFLLLGGVSLLVGALGIANVTLVSVIERVGEIGLRRALGTSRRHIAGQFLLESTTVGFLGGLVGASVGIAVVLGVALGKGWTPVLQPWLALAAPALGATVGLAAGAYPAWRAAAIEPIAALRHGS